MKALGARKGCGARLIQAAQVVALLPTGNRPATERVARELVPLTDQPEVLREVWQAVQAEYGDTITASPSLAFEVAVKDTGEARAFRSGYVNVDCE